MQVAEHIIAKPTTNQLDYVAVNIGIEESNGTYGAEGMIEDVLGSKSQVWAAEHDGGVEGLGYHGWRYIFHLPVGVMTRDRGVEGGALLSLRWRKC